MSNPAQPMPVPQQPSPTRIGQTEHPEDARRQAQVKNVTQISIEKAAQARSLSKIVPIAIATAVTCPYTGHSHCGTRYSTYGAVIIH